MLEMEYSFGLNPKAEFMDWGFDSLSEDHFILKNNGKRMITKEEAVKVYEDLSKKFIVDFKSQKENNVLKTIKNYVKFVNNLV